MTTLKAALLQHPEVVAFCLKRVGVPVFYFRTDRDFARGYRWNTGEGCKGDGPYWFEFAYSPHVKNLAPYKLPFPKCVFVVDHAGMAHSLFTVETSYEHLDDGRWTSRAVLEGEGFHRDWNKSPRLEKVIVIREEDDDERFVVVECDYKYVKEVQSWARDKHAYWPADELTKSVVTDCMGVYLAAFESALLQLHAAPITAYIPKPNPANPKRLAKGKKPLIDWTTVVVQPPRARGAELGGTHASPRRHERRGHYRVSAKGTRHWVKNHWVGSAKNGLVFHDYEVVGR